MYSIYMCSHVRYICIKPGQHYRIYSCIMRTFFSQIWPLKSRCALYTEPFVFMLGNLHNNTKSAKWNNSQFYAINQDKKFV